MKTLAVSEFKARCLGLLKEVAKTGNPLAVTLRGKALATVVPPQATRGSASVKSTLRRLQPLLMVEEEELDLPLHKDRASALAPLPLE